MTTIAYKDSVITPAETATGYVKILNNPDENVVLSNGDFFKIDSEIYVFTDNVVNLSDILIARDATGGVDVFNTCLNAVTAINKISKLVVPFVNDGMINFQAASEGAWANELAITSFSQLDALETPSSMSGGVDALQTLNDLYLDENNNLAMFDDINVNLTNIEALLAVIKNVVQTHRFELQLDMNKGIPYMQTIFENSTLVSLWRSYMIEAIEDVENVNFVEYFNTTYDPTTYTLKYECIINSAFGRGVLNESYVV